MSGKPAPTEELTEPRRGTFGPSRTRAQPHAVLRTGERQPDKIADSGFVDPKTRDLESVRQYWELGTTATDPDNLARWTEIHPPAVVSVLPAHPHKETVRSVLVARSPGEPSDQPTVLTATLTPPGPKPRPDVAVGGSASLHNPSGFQATYQVFWQ